jgi:group I intron endonuclease
MNMDGVPTSAGIYEIANLIDGKKYVGSACNLRNRFRSHARDLGLGRHHSPKLQNAWRKHGAAAFRFSILELVLIREVLLYREQSWIDSINPEYNVCRVAGSTLGLRFSDEAKAKIAAKARGRIPTEQARRRMADAQRGRHHSQATRAKMSASMRGLKRTPESRARMSAAKRGHPGHRHTPESIEKMAAAKRAYWARRRAGAAPL